MKVFKEFSAFFLLFFVFVIVTSCQKEDEILTNEKIDIMNNYADEGMIQLGKKLKNPYSVQNMEKAWENLKNNSNSRVLGDELDIRTTHFYIRYLPKDEAELDILEGDSSLILYDYPLDYEISEGGTYYHDPAIPQDRPTWQYAAVLVNYEPEDITYEIIEELYIPEEDGAAGDDNGRKASQEILIDMLVDEALRITDNLEEDEENIVNGRTMARKWNPSGRIQLFEDGISRNVGVRAAKVRAKRWFTTKETLTDANGNFFISHRFKKKVNYSIKWERNDFDIRNGTFAQAYYNGPKMEGAWHLNINSGKSRMYAIVHIAAEQYYYGNRFGLKSPPLNSFWKSRLKIGVYDSDKGSSHCKDCRHLGAIPVLYIKNPFRTTDQIYGTTIHEISHASHWELRKGNWNKNRLEERLVESWAQGVEWLFAVNRYRAFNAGYNYQGNYQDRTPANNPIYTSLVVDLFDDENQGLRGGGRPTDRAEHYSFLQMENVLEDSDGFTEFRDNLRNSYNNPSEGFLNELFNNWN